MKKSKVLGPQSTNQHGIVVDGYERLVHGVEAEARRTIEAKYADELNSAGMLKRWKLKRRIDAEIATLVEELMSHVSKDGLF
ncbi:hypothetical protein SH139x_003784 [Planctomycetaceae bacterium SH139]